MNGALHNGNYRVNRPRFDEGVAAACNLSLITKMFCNILRINVLWLSRGALLFSSFLSTVDI